jgi:hypothetical protein
MEGKFQAHPAFSRERYTNVEEFYAVVVTNVYLSERGAPLRWGHRDSTTLLTNPDTWLNHERNRNLVARFQREQALFALGLARSPAAFNPFRQLR